MELPLLEGGMQMLGPRRGVHDGDCLAYNHMAIVCVLFAAVG